MNACQIGLLSTTAIRPHRIRFTTIRTREDARRRKLGRRVRPRCRVRMFWPWRMVDPSPWNHPPHQRHTAAAGVKDAIAGLTPGAELARGDAMPPSMRGGTGEEV